MESHVTFASETVKKFVANHRRGSDYKSTIHNNSGQSITITVTNEDIQTATNFAPPAQGALVIANGAIDALPEVYSGWTITAGAPTTGTVDIVEAG